MNKWDDKEKAIYKAFTRKQKHAFNMVVGVLYMLPSEYKADLFIAKTLKTGDNDEL